MKKAFLFIAVAALVIAGCSTSTSTTDPTDITEVQEFSPSTINDSGATTIPTSETEIEQAFAGINTESDSVFQDISALFSNNESKAIFSKNALTFVKSLSSSFNSQITQIQQDFTNFPTTKKLDETLNLSGEDIGTYFTLTKGEATLTANATTSDNNAIASDGSNFKSLSGEGTAQIEINPTSALTTTSSVIKDFKLKTNLGATGSISTKTVNSVLQPDKISLAYAESFGFGLSINADGKGGKITFKEDASYSGDLDYAVLMSKANDEEALANYIIPDITITVKVYDDNDQIKFNRTYTSIDAFVTAFNMN